MAPQETSRLAWAKNVALPGFGHLEILGSGPDGHEEIEFFGETESLFGCRHMPASTDASAGVVICSPLFTDATVNSHREMRVGRWLARAGIVAQRFHYRGTGESDGDPPLRLQAPPRAGGRRARRRW